MPIPTSPLDIHLVPVSFLPYDGVVNPDHVDLTTMKLSELRDFTIARCEELHALGNQLVAHFEDTRDRAARRAQLRRDEAEAERARAKKAVADAEEVRLAEGKRHERRAGKLDAFEPLKRRKTQVVDPEDYRRNLFLLLDLNVATGRVPRDVAATLREGSTTVKGLGVLADTLGLPRL